MALSGFNETVIRTYMNRVQDLNRQVLRCHENFAGEGLSIEEQNLLTLNLQGTITTFIEELEDLGYKKADRVLRALPKVITSPNIFLDQNYYTELSRFLQTLYGDLGTDLSRKEIQTAQTVPENLGQLVDALDNSHQQVQEARQWKSILREQFKQLNADVVTRMQIALENTESQQLVPDTTARYAAYTYIADKVIEYEIETKNRRKELVETYNDIIQGIRTQVTTEERARNALKIIENRYGARDEVVTSIANVKRAATESRVDDEAAAELVAVRSIATAPVIGRITESSGPEKSEIAEENKRVKDLSTLPDATKRQITKQVNAFQVDVSRVVTVMQSTVESGGYINEEVVRAQINEAQQTFYRNIKDKTHIEEKDLPAFIRYSIQGVQIPQQIDKNNIKDAVSKLEKSSEQWKEQSVSKLVIINALKKDSVLEELLADDLHRFRQGQLKEISANYGQNQLFLDKLLENHRNGELSRLAQYHPYLSREALEKLLIRSSIIPGWYMISEPGMPPRAIFYSNIATAASVPKTITSAQSPGILTTPPGVRRPMGSPRTPSRIAAEPSFVTTAFPMAFGPPGLGGNMGGFGPTPSMGGASGPRGGGLLPSLLRNLLPSPGGLARSALIKIGAANPVVWVVIGVTLALFFIILMTTVASPIPALLPTGTGSSIGGGADDAIALGSCPITDSPRILGKLWGSYPNGGHGTDAYWAARRQPKGTYPMPDSEMIAGCNDESCPYYGYSIDVVSSTVGLPKVYVPVICPTNGSCSTDRTWKVVLIRGSRPEVFLETVDNDGPQLKIYLLHLQPLVTVGQTVKTGQQVAQIVQLPGMTPHLHYEVNIDGRPVDPTPFCDKGGSKNIPKPLPPNLGQCKQETISKYFKKDEIANAMCICNAESGGDASIQNRGCFLGKSAEHSIGLFQINLLVHDPPKFSCPAGYNWAGGMSKTCSVKDDKIINRCVQYMSDPENNTRYAAELQRSSGWRPWSTRIKCGL